MQDQVGPFFTVWGPMLIATLLLAPFALDHFRKNKKSIKDMLVFVQLALLGVFPAQVFMTWGTQYSTASNAAILTLSLPVVTAFFAYLLIKERMTITRWASFSVAIIGVILCSTSDIRNIDWGAKYAVGNLFIFLAIIGNSYYNVGCKKILNKYTEIEMVFFTYAAMIILLAPLVLYFEPDVFRRIPSFTKQTWIAIGLLTIFHNFLSMVLFFMALKALDAMQVALSNYLITFFALPIAAIWLGEILSLKTVAGGILIFASTLIITIVEYRINRSR